MYIYMVTPPHVECGMQQNTASYYPCLVLSQEVYDLLCLSDHQLNDSKELDWTEHAERILKNPSWRAESAEKVPKKPFKQT